MTKTDEEKIMEGVRASRAADTNPPVTPVDVIWMIEALLIIGKQREIAAQEQDAWDGIAIHDV